ncbi:MAG: thrombospondin type 3 repeat-containing protein [Desulfatiglandales bacterium]
MMEASISRKRLVRYIMALFICAVFSLATISAVSGKPFRTGNIPRSFGCGTCHIDPRGGGKRNAFGQDYERIAIPAGEEYTKELGALDSDGDGFTNDEEFAAGTHPGNPNWKP